MIQSANYLKALVGVCLIVLQVSNSSCLIYRSLVKLYLEDKYLCGGTLVKDNFALTSAGCVIKVQQNNVSLLSVAGNTDKDEYTPDDESSVINIFRPEDYNEAARYKDIAVLKLKTSITGSIIRPASLCSKKNIEIGTPIAVYHWNLKANAKKFQSNYNLSKGVLIRVVDYISFIDDYNDEKFVFNAAPDEEYMYCFYDRGGPATIDDEVCGIYIYGPTCLSREQPGTFTSLANEEIMQFITESFEK